MPGRHGPEATLRAYDHAPPAAGRSSEIAHAIAVAEELHSGAARVALIRLCAAGLRRVLQRVSQGA